MYGCDFVCHIRSPLRWQFTATLLHTTFPYLCRVAHERHDAIVSTGFLPVLQRNNSAALVAGRNCMHSTQIQALNDALRTTFQGGRVLVTEGVQALPEHERAQLLADIQGFDEFGEENDPHGEHDFGAITLRGNRFFWKIDYYNRSLDGGSEDPADPEKTTRVLSIMRAEEY